MGCALAELGSKYEEMRALELGLDAVQVLQGCKRPLTGSQGTPCAFPVPQAQGGCKAWHPLGAFASTSLISAGLGHALKCFAELGSVLEAESERGPGQFVLLVKIRYSDGMNQSRFLIGNSELEFSRTPFLSLLSIFILVKLKLVTVQLKNSLWFLTIGQPSMLVFR